ncbi:taste receptor type 2 member 105-like [Cricetulus griseus]|uniref:Taste receptor type 2 n=2 Tax=Cricetulus griseus TaxID=10029 RepID=A0A9J7GG23_CRIGR|nr:taste receptor type 2 member 105-like [Cricetulus griseus]XP_027285771.1 taste receptor type 2 member 105-like [Cricetulus griseus]
MLSAAEGVLLSIATAEVMLGLLGNSVITLANCMDWVKSKKLSKIGFLLTGLATSRIFVIWVITLDACTKIFFPTMHWSGRLTESISYIWVTVNHLNVWFAASLSIFYCLKIANFSHHVFLWLKKRTERVFFVLVGYLLTSLLVSYSLVVKIMKDNKRKHINRTRQIYLEKRESIINYVSVNIGIISLFMVTLTACFFLIISLWRHSRRMRSNVSGFRDLNTEAHVKAMKVLISFLILFILHFSGILIEILCLFTPENKLLFIFGFTVSSIYPCCHSFILILTSSQLQRASVRVLRGLKCCEKGKDLRSMWPSGMIGRKL